MKKLLLTLVSFVIFNITNAQVGVGTTSPNAALDVTSTNDGMLIPRIALSATNVATVLTPTQSELVYNTFTSPAGPNQVIPGFYYWDAITTKWIAMANVNDNKIATVNTVFDNLPNLDPVASPIVYCSGYWDKGDQGGGMFEWNATSTKDIDGGRYFASKLSPTGRWVRKLQDNVNVIHYGAIPVRDFLSGGNGNYGYGGVYFRNDIAMTWNQDPLSTKFATLTEAKAWYPRSVTALNDAIDAVAIQSTLEFNAECFIPEGVYVLNKALQLSRQRKIHGASNANTILHFIDCSGFVAKQSVLNNSTTANNGPGTDQNFIYLFNTSISDLSLIGNGLPTVTSQLATAAFDDTRCGINLPNNQNLPEANSNETPLAEGIVLSRLNISNFAGHGLKMLSHFTCSFDYIDVKNCGGHGIFIQGGNTTSLCNCYVHPVGPGFASYRILGGAVMIACNGNDSPQNTWGVFGMNSNIPISLNNPIQDEITGGVSSTFHLTQCNMEGMKRGLELRGTFTKVIMDACQLFPYNLDPAEPYLIIDKAYESTIRLSNCFYFLQGATPMEALIKAESNNVGSNYMVLGDYLNSTTNPANAGFNKVKYTDAAGVNIYGPGVLFDIPIITTSNLAYAVKGVAVNEFAAKSIYLGRTKNETDLATGNIAQILTGSGVPTIAATDGSIYMRTNGGAGATLFVRENGVWVAK